MTVSQIIALSFPLFTAVAVALTMLLVKRLWLTPDRRELATPVDENVSVTLGDIERALHELARAKVTARRNNQS